MRKAILVKRSCFAQRQAVTELCRASASWTLFRFPPFTGAIEMEWMAVLNSLEALGENATTEAFLKKTFPRVCLNITSYFCRDCFTWAAISNSGRVCHQCVWKGRFLVFNPAKFRIVVVADVSWLILPLLTSVDLWTLTSRLSQNEKGLSHLFRGLEVFYLISCI